VAESFVDELRENLTAGTAALILLVRDMQIEKVLPRTEEPGPVVRTSLSDDVEAQLEAVAAHRRRIEPGLAPESLWRRSL
jgi:uncharacterized membrane protein